MSGDQAFTKQELFAAADQHAEIAKWIYGKGPMELQKEYAGHRRTEAMYDAMPAYAAVAAPLLLIAGAELAGYASLQGIISTVVAGKGVSKVPANRLNHIFGKSEHALDGLVKQFGSQEKAYQAVQNAANQALKNGRLTYNSNGILPSGNAGNIVSVGGTKVRLIGGKVVDGKVILSSFSRKGL